MLQEAGYFPIAIKHNAGASYKAALEQWQVHANSEPFIQIVSACVETEIQHRLNISQITRAYSSASEITHLPCGCCI